MATPKQHKAVQLLSENIGADKPKPINQVLVEAGYSKETADSPSLVTKSKGFQDLLEKSGITDMYLAQKLKEGLEAKKPFGKEADIYPDYSTQHKFFESGLRLKGLAKEAAGPSVVVVPIYAGRSTD